MNIHMPDPDDGSIGIVPLSGLVGEVDGTPYADNRAVVEYVGTLQSHMMLGGRGDTANKYITYRVGVKDGQVMMSRPEALSRVDTSMQVSTEIQMMCSEMAGRNASMPATWTRMDLFGVVRRLAMGATYYSAWGTLTPAVLRGGGNVEIQAIAASVAPIAADAGAVFVSVKTVTHARPNVLAAFANAISGEGGTMYTDLLGVNSTGAVIVPVAQGAALAQGCHDALRILGAQFRACGKGAFFALAVSQGYHRIKTVHGHSDEGAYVRKVFRALEAGVPYGAVVTDIPQDNALPDPQRSIKGFRGVYDSIGLASAGAVALADPMVCIQGRDYPTLLTTENGVVTDPGENNVGDGDDARSLTTQWAQAAPAWAELYARALNKMFVTTGGEAEVVKHIGSQANSLVGQDVRHLRLKVAVAFCWVEPSSACPIGDDSFPAWRACHGPLAVNSRARVVAALDGCALLVDKSDAVRSAIQIDFRYARRHGLFVHLWYHVKDGLANVVVNSGTVNNFALVGGEGAVGDRILNGDSFASYLWGRGHSTVIAPGELINLDRSLVMTFKHTERQGFRVHSTHVPRVNELLGGDVEYTVSRLVGMAPAPPGEVPNRMIRRARTRATDALALAADNGRLGVVLNEQLMIQQLVDYGSLPPSAYRSTVNEYREDVINDGAGMAPETGPPGGREGFGGFRNGPQAPIRREHRREGGPRMPRTGPIRGGGVQGQGLPQAQLPPVGAGAAGGVVIDEQGRGVVGGQPAPLADMDRVEEVNLGENVGRAAEPDINLNLREHNEQAQVDGRAGEMGAPPPNGAGG